MTSNNIHFENRVAIVTGAGTGIGRAVALQLAEGGAKVVLVDYNETDLNKVKEELLAKSAEVTAYLSDVSVEEDAKRIVAETIKNYGKIDIMVNNAGIFRDTWGHFAESESKNWKRKLDINVLGTMYYAHEVLPNMLENHYGRIINVASVAGVYGIANMVDYSMTKGAVIAFTSALAKEVTEFGVTVNAVSPGNVKSQPHWKENLELSFLPRSSTPEEQANVICFLASEAASYVSGQNYLVDGCRKKM